MYKPGHGKFAVLGLGNFGTTIAVHLERLGNEVLGVDRDEVRIKAVADRLTHVVIADVRDERALEELGLADYDAAVVAIGEDLESNILSTLSLKSMGVARVWVKAHGPSHHRILAKLGADRIIHPEDEMGQRVANSLNYPFVLDYIALGGDYFIVEIEVTDKLDGQMLAQLDPVGQFGIRLMALKRDRTPVTEDFSDIKLKQGDRLVLLGPLEQLQRFGAEL
ncbi:MAG: TrkA family potassium uptake protein [Nitrococcus mobilis]|nr:TrkA family potassium uptake protein [Nitrococcus mobilis]